MSDVLELKDGSLITPINVFDVLDIVEEHLGTDLRQYLEEIFQDGGIVRLAEGDSLEEMEDHYKTVLMNVNDVIDQITKQLREKRLSRDRIEGSLTIIRKIIEREMR